MFAICRPQPNWMPRNPKFMFQRAGRERGAFRSWAKAEKIQTGPYFPTAVILSAAKDPLRRSRRAMTTWILRCAQDDGSVGLEGNRDHVRTFKCKRAPITPAAR